MIALLSVLCGGEGCHDMSLFGRSKEKFLRRFMVLEHGIPSHDAFSDLFNALDSGGFQKVILRLLGDFARNLEGVIAIDGKALRRSFDKASGKSPLHLVFACQSAFKTDPQSASKIDPPCQPFRTVGFFV